MRRWLARNVFFPLQERLKGHPTLQLIRDMEAAEWLHAEELELLRCTRLKALLEYCSNHVPYIREQFRTAGIHALDIKNLSDLSKLPIIRKSDIRNNRERLRSDIAGPLSVIATGGSTGEPLILDLSKRRVASRIACRERVSRWWGVSIGTAELALWGSPVELTRQDRIRRVRDWLLCTRLLPAFEMDEATILRYISIIEQGRWRQIFGYPSALHSLCECAQKHRRQLRESGVRVAFVTGEVLHPYQRDLISETLNCPVADGYGGRDSGFIAHECPQGGMHIMADAVIVEIVDRDGCRLPAGEIGEIVVTDLYSAEAPFIRYATGDLGALGRTPCDCGRAFPVLTDIQGRANDLVVTPDGRVINSLALIYPVRELSGVDQFRIVQKEPTRFHVQLVCNSAYDAHRDEELIRTAWAKLIRSKIDVTVEYVCLLAPERSGKFRHVVSEVVFSSGNVPAQSNLTASPQVDWQRTPSQGSNQ